jgi:SpoVK/Ycf46/Vps4 family AAA+-type ATPase
MSRFMTLWDGLTSTNASGEPARIVVLGATNRINDIDEAILRRMPKKFPVPLPDQEQRRRILQLVLGDTKRDVDFNMDYIAKVTAGMSGSDVKEACRDAAMLPMREYIREHRASGASLASVNPDHVRGLKTEDFFGRKGGGQILAENHKKRSSAKKSRPKSMSDGFEDVDDEVAPVSPD